MKLEVIVGALQAVVLTHPTVTGLHVWYDKTTGEFLYKKALVTDGVSECLSPMGGRYLGVIAKNALPCTAEFAQKWLTEHIKDGKSVEKPVEKPAERRPAQEQRACKTQAKSNAKKPVKRGKK